MNDGIDPRLEEQVRLLYGHALQSQLEDFTYVLNELVAADVFRDAMTLTYRITAVVAVGMCDNKRPSGDDLDRIADAAVEIDDNAYGLKPSEVSEYLARVIFAGESVDNVMDPEDAARLPFIIAANLLASASDFDKGEPWYEYLDKVEVAIEAARERA